MNITMRKLAMLEQNMLKQEEECKIQGFSTCPVDRDLQNRISNLMEKIRSI